MREETKMSGMNSMKKRKNEPYPYSELQHHILGCSNTKLKLARFPE